MSDPRHHYSDYKNGNISIDDLDDEVLGADVGSFVPYLGLISGLLGGGGDKKPDAQATLQQQQMAMQMQMMQMKQAEDAKRNQIFLFAGLGVAALGVLFFALRK